MDKANIKHLLFVCLGNICRSPAAEGVMKKLVSDAGLNDLFFIDSAGIGGWHAGELPDSRMRRCGALRGYCFDSRARQFRRDDFRRFDLIFVMDRENYRTVMSMAENDADKDKVKMLASYLNGYGNVDVVPDPYYGDDADFGYALDLIENACSSLLDSMMNDR